MRRNSTLIGILAPLAIAGAAGAQEIWSGYTLTFTKADFADWTLEANQDRITDSVWITRADSQGIFNIAQEASYMIGVSPADTEWGFGTTDDIASITFQEWRHAVGFNPPASVGQNMVVHLISEDIYIDIRFTSWTSMAAGGGFSYIRAVPPAPPCPGDIDGDDDTDVFDFGVLASNFGTTVPPGTNGDLDGDGDVDVFDFGELAADFGCVP